MLRRLARSIRPPAAVLVTALAMLAPAGLSAQENAPGAAAAEKAGDQGKIVLELNNASDTDAGACRLTFVASNGLGTGFDGVAWQVAVFDGKGVVRSLLVLEFGALSPGKTKIVLFDLPGRSCADISRVVVNDVAQCRAAGAAAAEVAPQCLDALATRSRGAIGLGV